MGAMRVEIPVSAAGAGETVRVDTFLALQGTTAPSAFSLAWVTIATIPVGDLPSTVLTDPLPEGTWLWYRAAEWTDGARVSNYTTPAVIEIPLRPGFSASGLTLTGADPKGPRTLSWTPNSLAVGVRVEWSVDEIGLPAALGNSADVAASAGELAIADLVAKGRVLNVRLTGYPGFTAGAVTGDPGQVRTLAAARPYSTITPAPGADPAADFACRVYVTSDLQLLHRLDGTLVISLPGAD